MTSQQLKEYCEAEFENINTVTSELFSVVEAGKSDYSVAELAAMATFIHNCYNGVENILKRVLSFRNIKMKDTPTWHKDLLRMSLEAGIITGDLYEGLITYLSFRHFFVHAYSFALKWDDMKPLAESLKETLMKFESAINDHIDKLD